MPCYTDRTITTDLAAANPEILSKGLVAAGFTLRLLGDGRTLSIDKAGRQVATLNGRILSGTSQDTLTAIKKAYASEVVRTTAKKYGLSVKAQENADHLRLVRRSL